MELNKSLRKVAGSISQVILTLMRSLFKKCRSKSNESRGWMQTLIRH